jgi:hypothetical protein
VGITISATVPGAILLTFSVSALVMLIVREVINISMYYYEREIHIDEMEYFINEMIVNSKVKIEMRKSPLRIVIKA